ASDIETLVYHWNFGDGYSLYGKEVRHIYHSEGDYGVALTVTDDDNSVSIDIIFVSISTSLPVAEAGPNHAVYTNTFVTFDGTNSYDTDGFIVSYDWDFGDGHGASGDVVTYSYPDDGIYIVTLTVTDNSGAVGTDTCTVNVMNRPPEASMNIVPDSNIDIIPEADIDVFESEVNIVTDHEYIKYWEVYTNELINFNASNSYDSDTNLNDAIPYLTYSWDFGDGTISNGVNTTHEYIEDGAYTVTLTVTDDDGAIDTDTYIINVLNRAPIAVFVISNGDNWGGIDGWDDWSNPASSGWDGVVSFDASNSTDPDGLITNYTWDFGDGTYGYGMFVNHTYPNGWFDQEIYKVVLTVTDNDADADEDCKVIITGYEGFYWYYETHWLSWPNFNNWDDNHHWRCSVFWWNYRGNGWKWWSALFIETEMLMNNDIDLNIYVNDTIHFSSLGSWDIDGEIANYTWIMNDVPIGYDEEIDYYFDSSGDYYLSLTVTDDYGSYNSTELILNVYNDRPIAEITITADSAWSWTEDNNEGWHHAPGWDGDLTFDGSASYDLSGAIVNYTWDFGDGTQGYDVIEVHDYAEYGLYLVTLTVTDDEGLNDTLDIVVIKGMHWYYWRVIDSETQWHNWRGWYHGCFGSSWQGSNFGWDNGVNWFSDGNIEYPAFMPLYFDGSDSFDRDDAIVNYTWDFGDGSFGYGKTVFHSYSFRGYYNTTLTVTDRYGATEESKVMIHIFSGPVGDIAPVADAGDDRVVYEDEDVIFDGSNSHDDDGSIVLYSWDFGNGNFAVGETVSNIYEISGDYVVTLTVTDNTGNSATDTAFITVINVIPTANAGPDQVVTEDDEVFFNGSGWDSASDIGGLTYSWDFDDRNLIQEDATGTSPTNVYTLCGDYTVTLTVTDDDGDTAVDTLIVTVNNEPPIAIAGDDQAVNEDDIVYFHGIGIDTPSDIDSLNYTWDFNDGNQAYGIDVEHIFDLSGVYSVLLTVTDDDGATGTDELLVTVSNVLPIAIAGDDQVVNEDDLVHFNASYSEDTVSDNDTLMFFWDYGDGNTSRGMCNSYRYLNSGEYTVTLTVMDDDGDICTDTLTITVNNVEPEAFAGYNQTIFGTKVWLNGIGLDTASDISSLSYLWDFGDAATSNERNCVHVYGFSGIYSVTLTVTDDDGASVTDLITVTIHADIDGDGLPDEWEVSHGLDPYNGLPNSQNGANGDRDNDGLTNIEEYWIETVPAPPSTGGDTDQDGLGDSNEIFDFYFFEEISAHYTLNEMEDGVELELNDYLSGNHRFTIEGTATINPDDEVLLEEAMFVYLTVGDGEIPVQLISSYSVMDSFGMYSLYDIIYTFEFELLNGIDGILIELNDDIEVSPFEIKLDSVMIERQGIDPTNKDFDDDGLIDGDETPIYGTSPYTRDADKDGFWDGAEYDYWTLEVGLSVDMAIEAIHNSDYDMDSLPDGIEMAKWFTLPQISDTDADNSNDGDEIEFWAELYNAELADSLKPLGDADDDGLANIHDPHSDSDGLLDGDEINLWAYGENYHSDPSIVDTDEDGVDDKTERQYSCHPNNVDTDEDGLTDYDEINMYPTSPTDRDSDNDGLLDGNEIILDENTTVQYGTPGETISIERALNDVNSLDYKLLENEHCGYGVETDADDPDSDDDGMLDGWELFYGYNPLNADGSQDLDTDGLSTIEEYYAQTSPSLDDSDNDGVSDNLEVVVVFRTDVVNGAQFIGEYEQATALNWIYLDVDSDGQGDKYYYDSMHESLNVEYDEYGNVVTAFEGSPLLENIDIFITLEDGTTITIDSTTNDYIYAWSPDSDHSDEDLDGELTGICYKFVRTDIDLPGKKPTNLILMGQEILLDSDDDGKINAVDTDSDGDGMPDWWETDYNLDIMDFSDAEGDPDLDTLLNLGEYEYDTHPNDYPSGISIDTAWDYDGDGMPDGWEVEFGLDPKNDLNDDGPTGDQDNDDLLNIDEYDNSTYPTDSDTDDDDMPDGWEVEYGLEPTDDSQDNGADGDADQDGLINIDEFIIGTYPCALGIVAVGLLLSRDFDEDDLPDGWEDKYSLNPKDDGSVNIDNGFSGDPDEDGIINIDEYSFNIPLNWELDDEGVYWNGISPILEDTDSDSINDDLEDMNQNHRKDPTETDPRMADTDNDGLDDALEISIGTDPLFDDTDKDGLKDGDEVNNYGTDPLKNDTDDDGLLDLSELTGDPSEYWGQYASNSAHTSYTHCTAEMPFDYIWQEPLELSKISSKDGIIYGTSTSTLVALYENTGYLIWEKQMLASIESIPVIINGIVIVACDNDIIYALSSVDGSDIWELNIDGALQKSVITLYNEHIYLGTDNNILYSINLDGAISWETPLDSEISSPICADSGTLFISTISGTIYALGAISGTEMWKKDHGIIFTRGLVYNSKLIVASNNKVLALNILNGEEIWEAIGYGVPTSQLGAGYGDSMTNGITLLGTDQGLFVLNEEDGTLLWDVPGSPIYSLAITDNMIFVNMGNSVYTYNLSGTEIWNEDMQINDMIITDGLLILASLNLVVYTICNKAGVGLNSDNTNIGITSSKNTGQSSLSSTPLPETLTTQPTLTIDLDTVWKLDDIGGTADWRFCVGVYDFVSWRWWNIGAPDKDNTASDNPIFNNIYDPFTVDLRGMSPGGSTIYFSFMLYDFDSGGSPDLADISALSGEGKDDWSLAYPTDSNPNHWDYRGAHFVMAYDVIDNEMITGHAYSDPVYESSGLFYTSGELDGGTSGDQNDARVWFSITGDTYVVPNVNIVAPSSAHWAGGSKTIQLSSTVANDNFIESYSWSCNDANAVFNDKTIKNPTVTFDDIVINPKKIYCSVYDVMGYLGSYHSDYTEIILYNEGPTVVPGSDKTTNRNKAVTSLSATATDPDDSTANLQFRWDYQDDGIWDTTYSSSRYAPDDPDYPTLGTPIDSTSGYYDVRVEVKDPAGLTHSDTLRVTVENLPPVVSSATWKISDADENDVYREPNYPSQLESPWDNNCVRFTGMG
ncbi:MAG: PKD domain-containing protein, partial [Candidatus Peribacteraceae bacterium]|nr:PKD domain-containing protein [Candidatus Peribacteraceae bacterium]